MPTSHLCYQDQPQNIRSGHTQTCWKSLLFFRLPFPIYERSISLCLPRQSDRPGWDAGLGRDSAAATVTTVAVAPPMHMRPDLMRPMLQHRSASFRVTGWACDTHRLKFTKRRGRHESERALPLHTSDDGQVLKTFHFFFSYDIDSYCISLADLQLAR